MKINEILSRLKGARRLKYEWQAVCPTHDAKNPRLPICEENGKILPHRFVGCPTTEIVRRPGLAMSDLMPERAGSGTPEGHSTNAATFTLAEYAKAKKLPIEFLQSLDLSDIRYKGRPAIRSMSSHFPGATK
jgi:hypothetical protein